jgi:hypothetical protein
VEKKKVAIVYDTSFLTRDFQSIKKFILARRFSSLPKPRLLGSLLAKLGGKEGSTDDRIQHDGASLFDVKEVVPKDVIKEVAKLQGSADKEHPAVASLVADGATRVDLAMDSVAGGPLHGSAGSAELDRELEQLAQHETDERICRYAARLVSYGPKERFDLAIVATEDEDLLKSIAKMAKEGKAIIGVKSSQLTATRILQDKLAEAANSAGNDKLAVES